MLKVKAGVQPPLIYIVAAIANVSERRAITITITSGLDGKHSEWSGHYQLRCVDARSKGFSKNDKEMIRADIERELKMMLPVRRIYVGLHDAGNRNEHFHVQFK